MFALIVQTILLIAIAFILGCILGCLLHSWLAAPEENTSVAPVAASAPPAAAPKPKPKPPVPPVPAKPVEKAPVVATPAPKAPVVAQAVAVAAADAPDNLKLIRGIGPQNEARLNNLNFYQFAQIAAWSKKDQREYGEALSFPGRIEREEWVKQAKVLAKGGESDFSRRVSSGSVSTSVGAAANTGFGTKPEALLLDAPRGGKADNLTLIDGVGNAIEKKMFKLGVYHFDQIAAMNADGIAWLGTACGFPGRAERENRQGESKILGEGGTTEHAQRVEKGQIKTSRKS